MKILCFIIGHDRQGGIPTWNPPWEWKQWCGRRGCKKSWQSDGYATGDRGAGTE